MTDWSSLYFFNRKNNQSRLDETRVGSNRLNGVNKMSQLVADCPRCGAEKITFELTQEHYIGEDHGWWWYETFCICRHCKRTTIFVLSQNWDIDRRIVHKNGLLTLPDTVNNYMNIKNFISLKDTVKVKPPEHIPNNIEEVFKEAATCMSLGCYNAAGTMFRLCLDLATRVMLPEDNTNGLNNQIRRSLGLRLPWLFDNSLLPEALRELSSCVKEDGNDGAHAGNLGKQDVEDLLDFTDALLERIYTEPERLRLAKERRDSRRNELSTV